MRLLLISVDAPPRIGGVSLTAHHLAEAFAEAEGWAALLGPRGACVPRGFDRSYALIEDWESRVECRAGAEAADEDARVAALVARAVGRYGVEGILLAHAFYYGPGAIRAARAAGIGVACLAHGLEIESQLGSRAAPAGGRDPDGLPARLKATLDGVDRVFANSAHTAEVVARAGAAAPASVCGVGLSEAVFARETARSPAFDPAGRAARRAALGLPPEAPLLVSVGRLVAHKRVDRTLDLAARLPGAWTAVIGEGPERATLETTARRLGIEARTRFLGALDEADKWAWLRAADFLLLMSEADPIRGAHEGFGIALLEGCAAGAVPVGSGEGGMTDFLIKAGGGLALGGAEEAAAVARLAALRTDPAARAAIVARGRAAIAERWLWPRIARRILAEWPKPRTVQAAAE